jgi:hypothetical protein
VVTIRLCYLSNCYFLRELYGHVQHESPQEFACLISSA